jgi:hypothetical protein
MQHKHTTNTTTSGGAANPSSGVDLMNPRRPMGGRPFTHIIQGRGCTGEFSRAKAKKKVLVPHTQEQLKQKKHHEAQFVPPPKSVISTFDDGGQYSPVIIISRCYHRVLPALAT